MDQIWDLNLIHFLEFYLAAMFVLGTWVRIRQYRAVLSLVRAVPGRWPKLFQLVKGQGHVLLTWSTVGPGLLALTLTVVQSLAARWIWPEAGRPPHGLTVARLVEHWAALPWVGLFGTGMLGIDLYFLLAVGEVDRKELEKYFDQAEFWLKSWYAPVVRLFTLGRINPRQMVATEVRAALLSASRMLNATLWWVSAQVALRIGFGVSLWLTYAWTRVGAGE